MHKTETLKIIDAIEKSKCILFDMDGVLLQSEELNWLVYKRAFETVLDCRLSSNYRSFFQGTRARDSVPKLLEALYVDEAECLQNLFSEMRRIKLEMILQAPCLKTPDIDEFLECLRSMDKQLGLVTSTSSEMTNFMISHLKLKQFFSVVLTADCVQNGKPHPEGYLKAASLLDIASPSECLVWEDSPAVVSNLLKLGFNVIFVREHPDEKEANHSHFLETGQENLSLILNSLKERHKRTQQCV